MYTASDKRYEKNALQPLRGERTQTACSLPGTSGIILGIRGTLRICARSVSLRLTMGSLILTLPTTMVRKPGSAEKNFGRILKGRSGAVPG